ncbi:MAG: hypothetical protein ACIAQU_07235 [Phycisphaerales bacterium JB064]
MCGSEKKTPDDTLTREECRAYCREFIKELEKSYKIIPRGAIKFGSVVLGISVLIGFGTTGWGVYQLAKSHGETQTSEWLAQNGAEDALKTIFGMRNKAAESLQSATISAVQIEDMRRQLASRGSGLTWKTITFNKPWDHARSGTKLDIFGPVQVASRDGLVFMRGHAGFAQGSQIDQSLVTAANNLKLGELPEGYRPKGSRVSVPVLIGTSDGDRNRHEIGRINIHNNGTIEITAEVNGLNDPKVARERVHVVWALFDGIVFDPNHPRSLDATEGDSQE